MAQSETQTDTQIGFFSNNKQTEAMLSCLWFNCAMKQLTVLLSFFTSCPPWSLLSLAFFASYFCLFTFLPFPFSPLFLVRFSDWRFQIASEFHHKTPLCSPCPCCLLPNTQRYASAHTRVHAKMPPGPNPCQNNRKKKKEKNSNGKKKKDFIRGKKAPQNI